MEQEFKAVVRKRGRLTIPQPYILADSIMIGDILKITIEKVSVNKDE